MAEQSVYASRFLLSVLSHEAKYIAPMTLIAGLELVGPSSYRLWRRFSLVSDYFQLGRGTGSAPAGLGFNLTFMKAS